MDRDEDDAPVGAGGALACVDARARAPSGGGVRYSAGVVRALLRRVAAGEPLSAICGDAAMPSQRSVAHWARARPAFARRLTAAKAAGGRAAAAGPLSTYDPVVAQAIFDRMSEGESVTAICRDPAMPSFSTFYFWRRRYPEFAELVAAARQIQAERFCDLGWEIAEAGRPETAYLTDVKLKQLRWMAGVLSPKRFGKVKPVAHEVETEVGPRRMDVVIRRFAVEPGPDGKPQVVGYYPDPATGRVVREEVPERDG